MSKVYKSKSFTSDDLFATVSFGGGGLSRRRGARAIPSSRPKPGSTKALLCGVGAATTTGLAMVPHPLAKAGAVVTAGATGVYCAS